MKTKIISKTISEVKTLLNEKNLLEFNRNILPHHVQKMQASILDCGVLRLPVLGDVSAFDKRGEVIIDGQHFCSAVTKMRSMDRPDKVDFIIKKYNNKKEVVNDISKLNNTQKTWNDENYLNTWFRYGKDNIEHFSNYAYLYNAYDNIFDGLPCGYLVDLYAVSKTGFREGTLEFRDREFSDKLAQLSLQLKQEWKKGSFTLQGLRMWAFERLNSEKSIDWVKLQSRLMRAVSKSEDKYCQGREDFRQFVEDTYTRV